MSVRLCQKICIKIPNVSGMICSIGRRGEPSKIDRILTIEEKRRNTTHGEKRRVEVHEGGGVHHSVAMSGCYLHLLSSALAGARG